MSSASFKTEEFAFRISGAAPEGVCKARAMTEAQFLAGEDARGVFVVLEPETPLGAAQFDALADARRMSSQNQAKSRQK